MFFKSTLLCSRSIWTHFFLQSFRTPVLVFLPEKDYNFCATVTNGDDETCDELRTPHVPFMHPQWPAPQSIGPWQTSVHMRLQACLYALLIQLPGWQHSAGTQSSSVVQLCSDAGIGVTVGMAGVCGSVGTGETGTVVGTGVGEPYPPMPGQRLVA